MKPGRSKVTILLEKVREQVSLAQSLISLIPSSALEWRPEILTQPHEVGDQRCQKEKTESASPEAMELERETSGGRVGGDLLRMGDLLGHLLDCMAGFCALLYSINDEKLAHFARLRGLKVNHFCGISEAQTRMREYMSCIEEGFAVVDDTDLCKLEATIFVPKGEPVLVLLLGNLEHLINHKYQLFFYLRLLGATVSTRDLYRFRGE